MTNEYTRGVLEKARELQRLEAAALAMPQGSAMLLRAGLAAALAGLMMLFPAISAAQMIF